MYTVNEITQKYKDLANSLGEIFNTPVIINSRLTRTFGRVVFDIVNGVPLPNRIEISRQLLETATKESIDEVLIHEFCHWYLMVKTKIDHKHDEVFKELCQRLGGGSGKSTTKVQRTVANNQIYKYQCYCSNCGKEIGHYSRRPKVMVYPDYYSTVCCNATIVTKQNW